MEINEGYISTEIGLVPTTWRICRFKECSFMKGRIGWQGLKETEFTFNAEQPFLITGMNFKDGEIRWNEVYHVSEDRYRIAKEIQLKEEDVLMTKDGTIGKLLYVNNIPYPYKATLNSHLLVFRPINQSYFPKYLYYNLSSPFFSTHVELNKSGSTFFGISQESVGKYKLILPPLPEQKAIAEVLTDTDNLIQALEKQIAKKRLIKEGVMQELLRPKEGWVKKKFGEILSSISDYTANGSFAALKSNVKYYSDRNYAVLVRTTDLDKPVFIPERFTDIVGYQFLSKTSLFGGELILANVGSIGKVFKVPHYNMPMTLAPNTYLLKLQDDIFKDFVYQWMLTDEFKTKLLSKVGSTTLLAINKDNLRDIEVSIPISYAEQKRVSIILSDMDDAIHFLETRLQKHKKVKQALMQQLLTGKIRLIES